VAPRGDLAAVVAIAVLLTQILLAQLTLGLSICLVIIGRAGRWRPLWLVAPAAVGLAWMLSIGTRHALAGYLAGGGQLISYLTGSGSVIARLAHLPGAFGGWRQWLPRQLPVALIAAAVQSACLASLGRPGQRREYRPGLIIAARRVYLAAVIRGGELATTDGGCVGIAPATGRRTSISWREAESGVLCTGQDASTVVGSGLALVSAAIQRRKTVIIVDLAGRAAGDGGSGSAIWHSAGGEEGWTWPGGRDVGLVASITRACADAGAPLRCFGWTAPVGWDSGPAASITRASADTGPPPRRPGGRGGCYEPFSGVDPARAAALVQAMIDWRGASRTQRQFCADYLNAALAVIAATPAGPPARPVAVLPEVAGLLSADALGARLRRVPGYPQRLDPPISRAHDLAGQLASDPALVTPLAAQLSGLRSAELGRWLRPASGGGPAAGPASPAGAGAFAGQPGRLRPEADEMPISLSRSLADREVVLFALDRRRCGRSAVMIARLAVADLTATLAERRAIGAPADCLVWISGCEALDPNQLTALLAAGAGTGTAVLLGTAAEPAATRLAADVNVVMVRGPAPPGLAGLLGPPGPAWHAHDRVADPPANWNASPEPGQIGPGTMPDIGPGWPARFSFETNGSTEVSAAELLRQRPDELTLLVRSPQRRLLLRARAAR
jgi:hypothetical protein